MKTQEIKTGNIGSIMDGSGTLWRVAGFRGGVTNGEEFHLIKLEDIAGKLSPCEVAPADFWPLLDSFTP
jgi:hypothetical protein